jgi:hypothetical protein
VNVDAPEAARAAGAARPAWQDVSLLDALLRRRSRRFFAGATLDGGPLAYASALPAQPLTLAEEAALVFAGAGVTGYALAELPYQPGQAPESGGGNIMSSFVGRTIPAGDAIHAVALCVTNDDGAWFIRRPQDYPRGDIPELVAAARAGRFVELYERARVRIAQQRVEAPREVPFQVSFNKWSANQPGTTYFVPVNELSALYINVLLAAFSRDYGALLLDERNRFQPAGLGRFRRSKGGWLHDDPAGGRVGTIWLTETWLYEFAALEQGAMLQNLGLMAAALGLGGFAHFAAHPYAWPRALGFRMQQIPLSRAIGANRVTAAALRALKRDLPVPTPLGLERAGEALITPWCPPYYPSMRAAVLAFVDAKYRAGSGLFRDGGAASAWRDGAAVQAGIPAYPDEVIEATCAYCEYVYARYGRFPAYSGPTRTVLAYQAHHLDPAFYERFYQPGAVAPA